jgi:hypothetical protein
MAISNSCECQYVGRCKHIRKLSAALYEVLDSCPDALDVPFIVVQKRKPYFTTEYINDRAERIEVSCGFLKKNSYRELRDAVGRSFGVGRDEGDIEFEAEGEESDGEESNLERVLGRIERVIGRKIEFSIPDTIDGDRMQAAAYDTGEIAITRYLKENSTEDELAFIVGHEVSHQNQKAGKEKAYEELAMKLVPILDGFDNALEKSKMGSFGKSVIENVATLAIAAGLFLYVKSDNRKREVDADVEGIEIASKAGYDAEAAINALQKFDPHLSRSGFWQYLIRNHPDTIERIEKIEDSMWEIVEDYYDGDTRVTTKVRKF